MDLIAPAEPVPSPDVLTSEKAAADYEITRDAWARGMQAQIGRLCRWAKDMGMRVGC